MKNELTGSWKKNFDYRFIAGEDLTKDVQLTIKAVGMDEAFNGKQKEDVVVVSFVETDKMMVLNKTNAIACADLFGDESDAWQGQAIELFSTKTSFSGRMVPCIRVRAPQQPPPEPTPQPQPQQPVLQPTPLPQYAQPQQPVQQPQQPTLQAPPGDYPVDA